MTNGGANPGWPVQGLVSCRTAGEPPTVAECEQVAESLREAQIASEQAGDAVLAQTLAVACRICLACIQCRTEIEWHRRAHEKADQRKHELRRQFHSILDLINRHEAPEAAERREGPPGAPAVETSLPAHSTPEPAEHLSFWQRIRSLVGQRPGPWPHARGAATLSPLEYGKHSKQRPPSLVVYCLGPFRVYQDDQPVEEWPSNKGKCIFKYLVTHRERPVAKEVLMELFWPSAHPDAARNNLNVAIYGLRQALRQTRPSFSHVLFQDDCYLLNPDLKIWVDCEAFMEHLTTARALEHRWRLAAAMREYRAAEALYQGEFLEEDRYEDWLIPQRQGLQDDYLSLLDRLSHHYFEQEDYGACATVCSKMLAVDSCHEEAHRRLMHCYSRQGQPYLALRQYHLCKETLEEELDAPPTSTTTAFYERVRKGERI
jgi:DNA-binding SARP family transcriptional activator